MDVELSGERKDERVRSEKPGYIVIIALAAIVLVVTLVFNGLTTADVDLFNRSPGDTADLFNLDVTPAGWTFSIWGFIYAYQVILVLYALTLTCRRNELSRGKLYYDPPFLPPVFFAIYILANILNVTWLFTFDGEYLVASMVALIGITLALGICLYFAVSLMWKYEAELSRRELWFDVAFVQNALGIYVAWTTIASSLNIGIVIRYEAERSMATASWVVLSIVLGISLIYAALDFFVFTVTLRYVFTPYIVLIVASAGIVDKNFDNDVAHQRFAVGILGTAAFLLVVKISLTIYRAIKQPSPLEIEN